MRRSTERTLVMLLLLITGVYAVAEEVTLMTYYPSPRGVYDELRTTGNVSIGSLTPAPAPGSRLKVVYSGTTASEGVAIQNTLEEGLSGIAFQDNLGTNKGFAGFGNPNHATWADEMMIGTNSTNELNLVTNNIRRLSINNNGDVGIGTAAPATKLHIQDGVIRLTNSGANANGPGQMEISAPNQLTAIPIVFSSIRGDPATFYTKIEMQHSGIPQIILEDRASAASPVVTTTISSNDISTGTVETTGNIIVGTVGGGGSIHVNSPLTSPINSSTDFGTDFNVLHSVISGPLGSGSVDNKIQLGFGTPLGFFKPFFRLSSDVGGTVNTTIITSESITAPDITVQGNLNFTAQRKDCTETNWICEGVDEFKSCPVGYVVMGLRFKGHGPCAGNLGIKIQCCQP